MKKPFLFLSFIIILFFATNTGESFAFARIGAPAYALAPVQTQVKQQNDKTKQLSIPEKNKYAITHIGKTGLKYKFLKFVLSMLGVLVSSLAIFLGLNFYKKFVLKNNAKSDNIDYSKNLESPKTFKEAINLFLNKSDK